MKLFNLSIGVIITLFGVKLLLLNIEDFQGWLSTVFGIGLLVSVLWFDDTSSTDMPSDGGDWGSGDYSGDGSD